jgi:glyoxylase-like metal-dependent hydrolase (beta-lactamase superfamily II)
MRAGVSERACKGGPAFQLLNRLVMPFFMPAAPAQAVDALLEPGQLLPILGGVRVIASPGHTPEHLSFFAEQHGILFAGDSMRSLGGKISFVDGPFTWDLARGLASLRDQARLAPTVLCCGNGPVLRGAAIRFPEG